MANFRSKVEVKLHACVMNDKLYTPNTNTSFNNNFSQGTFFEAASRLCYYYTGSSLPFLSQTLLKGCIIRFVNAYSLRY